MSALDTRTSELIERLRYGSVRSKSEYLAVLCADAADMIEQLHTGHRRYEIARRMNPRQWAAAWDRNIAGERFDDIIDGIGRTQGARSRET